MEPGEGRRGGRPDVEFPVTRDGGFDAYQFCNPFNHRSFCSLSKAWDDYLYAAWDWSKAHPNKDDRAPVPYPSAVSGLGYRWGFVYVVAFRPQGFVGSDRQVRGLLLDVLRAAPDPVPQHALDVVWADGVQRARALDGLVADGLVDPLPDGRYALPG